MDDVRRRALEGALGFLGREGAELASLRIEALLGRRPEADVAEALAGGVGPCPSPRESLVPLRALADHRLHRHPLMESLTRRLEETQEPDGSWSPGPDAGPEERLHTTGAIAGCLARSAFVREVVLERAGAYLAARWSPERVEGADLAGIATFAPFLTGYPHEMADAALQWCGRELERGFRTAAFDPVQTARVLLSADAHALPGAKVDAKELVPALLQAQDRDGGFGGPRDAAARIAATVDAALALARFP